MKLDKVQRKLLCIAIITGYTILPSEAAPVIWTDSNSPMGNVYISPGNPIYGGDVHIQNNNTFSFTGNVNNSGVLLIESGGKLVADGHIETKATGMLSNPLLLLNGGKAYFNGGLTAEVLDPNSNAYGIAVRGVGSDLLINGNTNVIAPNFTGFGIYVEANTLGQFNGNVNIDVGVIGIYNEGTSIYNKNVNINLIGPTAGSIAGVNVNNSTTGSLTFNGDVTINVNSNNPNAYSYGIFSSHTSPNGSTFNGNLVINQSNDSNPFIGVYALKNGQVDINNNLTILQTEGIDKYALYSDNTSKININNSVIHMTGKTQAIGNSVINLNSLPGSAINGSTILQGAGQIHYNLNGTQWNLSQDAELTSLSGSGSNIHIADPHAASFRTLSIGSLSGNGQTFWLNTRLDDGSSQQTDKVVITNAATGAHQLHISNAGGSGALTMQGIEVVDASVATTNTAQFSLANLVVQGGYEYILAKGALGNWYLNSNAYERPDGGINIANQLESTKLLLPSFYLDPNRMENMWMYVEGGKRKGDAAQGRIRYKADTSLVTIGADHKFDAGEGSIRLGGLANISYINSSSHSRMTGSDADGSSNGYAIGAYMQWQAKRDDALSPYIDTIASFGWFDNKVKTAGNPDDSYDSTAWAITVRGGYPIALTNTITLEPQLQFTYLDANADSYTDFSGARVSTKMSGNLVSRVGVMLQKQDNPRFTPYISLSAWYDGRRSSVAYNYNNDRLSYRSGKAGITGDIRAGFKSTISPNWLIWGEAGFLKGDNHYQEVKGTLGVSYTF